MEDHILPPYYRLLAHLLPDHLARNQRITKLLTAAHDEMIDAHEAKMLLNIYRRFMEVILSGNHDPLLTERVRDAFVQAVTDVGATLGIQSARGLSSSDGQAKSDEHAVDGHAKADGYGKIDGHAKDDDRQRKPR